MSQVAVRQYDFNANIFDDFNTNHYAKDLWPLVYILSDENVKEAYIGETTDAYARMGAHLNNNSKKRLTTVHLITSDKFNKSATLDIESNLIKYISGDGKYKLLNGNLGLANHNYYQKKEVYWDIFNSIWNSLRSEGITKHSIEHIDNSDLFKYSPYKTLTLDQRQGLLVVFKSLLDPEKENIIVEGGAGTGKTILAIFLFKILNSSNDDFNFKEFGDDEKEFIHLIDQLKTKYSNPKMALVVPMASFRSTLKKVFKNIKGLSAKMVIGPAEVAKEDFDIILVDESHRLRRRINLGAYYGAFDKVCERLQTNKSTSNELEWVVLKSKKTILFYDESQSIKPSDVAKESFDELKKHKSTSIEKLKSQFRVRGGNAYVNYITNMLNGTLSNSTPMFKAQNYEFLLFDSMDELVSQIKLRNRENGLSRLIAGYSWSWVSNKDPQAFDIEIDNIQLKWNGTATDWINSENSINEVGCIHTTQGYDLNYAGIIFGNEITYNKQTGTIEIVSENYFDKNGKQSINDPEELKTYIINIYKTILLRGIKGAYVYVCDDNLREYLSQHIPAKPYSKTSVQTLNHKDVIPFENAIPLYDLNAAAGNFSEAQNIQDYEWISPPKGHAASKDLFACKVVGESMNKIIPNGSICLFNKYSGGSRNGRIVLVEHTDIQDADFGSCYTVKEYQSKKTVTEEGWNHQTITLLPLSTNSDYHPLELEENDAEALKVIGVFESVIDSI